MKLFFAFLCSIYFCNSTAFAMNSSEQKNVQQKQLEKNALPLQDPSTQLPTAIYAKSKRVITVRIYTEEDCD